MAFRPSSLWTAADDQTLRSMWAEGKSASQIGKILARTRSAVCGRALRVGLNRVGVDRNQQRRMSGKIGRARQLGVKAVQPGRSVLPPRIRQPLAVSDAGFARTVLTVAPGECRFMAPSLHEADRHTPMCGAAADGTYCEEHQRIVWRA